MVVNSVIIINKTFRNFLLLYIIISLILLCDVLIYNCGKKSISKTEFLQGEINVLFQTSINDNILKKILENEDIIAQSVAINENFVQLKVADQDMDVILHKLNNLPMIIEAEPNYILKNNNIGNITNNLKNDTLIFQNQINDNNIIVAVIDTGIDTLHPDLKNHIWINTNEIENDGIDNDINGYVDDINGWDFYNNDNTLCSYKYNNKTKEYVSNPNDCDNHGTHVAGIIVSNYVKLINISKLNSNIKIMSLKIQGGADGNGSIAAAISAIKYATANGAKICNMSLGGYTYSRILEKTIRESNMLFVTAAGNNGNDNDVNPVYPASFDLDNILSIAYTDKENKLERNSNYGKNSVDVVAPGTNILSTIVGGNYNQMNGSSIATPYITSIAALLYSYQNYTYPISVKNIITKSLDNISLLKDYVQYPGILNTTKIIGNLSQLKIDIVEPSIMYSYVYNGKKFMVNPIIIDKGGSEICLSKWLNGKKLISDFSRGTIGHTINSNLIILDKEGFYTLYSSDYSGNEKVLTMFLHNIQGKKLFLRTEKVHLKIGERYQIEYKLIPTNATDEIKYCSSNDNIASVSNYGKVTANQKGNCRIKIQLLNKKHKYLYIIVNDQK
ncbi:Ig-like protein group 2 [Mobilisporobacter senegalensis]|uniref:Ig-like protein group 2 n=1 Tax=Mobilisporobacter senegalensis TaxID=1329262 RepID=A0A3N1XYW3_9FIRM|nr:S8 family serine peptidase [Mobilisporobacter senegalensis]ROR31793.1 Ig-like protein group 2 [Mobilisporobacter senegalensis]